MIDVISSSGTRLSTPTLPTLDGLELDIHSLRGKKVLLFMWGSW